MIPSSPCLQGICGVGGWQRPLGNGWIAGIREGARRNQELPGSGGQRESRVSRRKSQVRLWAQEGPGSRAGGQQSPAQGRQAGRRGPGRGRGALPAHPVLLWPCLGVCLGTWAMEPGLWPCSHTRTFWASVCSSVRRVFSNKVSEMWRFLRRCHMKCLSRVYLAGACSVLREKAQAGPRSLADERGGPDGRRALRTQHGHGGLGLRQR